MTLDARVSGLERRFGQGRIIVTFTLLAVGVLFVITIANIRASNAREARDDAEKRDRDKAAAVQRATLLSLAELQHECSFPAAPKQHNPEPQPHVHECWDQALGAILTAVAVDTKHTEQLAIALSAPERQRIIADALAKIERSTEDVLGRVTLFVRDPSRPDRPPFQVTPVIAPPGEPAPTPTPCEPAVNLGNVGVGQGLVCKR